MGVDFVLEVGCEEIPARFVESTLGQLVQRLSESLSEHSIEHSPVLSFATPRRLIAAIEDLAARQHDRTEAIAGPPLSVAFDAKNQPTPAAMGFANKYQVPIHNLHCIETEKGKYLGFERRIPGLSSEELLARELPVILGSLEFPKNMRWEESQFAFIRPIRWLLCLLGGRVIPFTVAGVKSGNRSFGHRMLSGDEPFDVNGLERFRSELLKRKVIFDPQERLQRISESLAREAERVGGEVVRDDTLLRLILFLNEHPTVLSGGFDPAFLRIPREVLVSVMREHQKYLSLTDRAGTLLPRFLVVVDSDDTFSDKIRAGHERVLKARLADAAFFWDGDRSIRLEDRVAKLDGIIFQQGLGTILDKTNRLIALVAFLARATKHSDLVDSVRQAARLAKADLTTEMVKELTELQGVMGGLYARSEGLPAAVAQAIYEHYRPAALDDESPRTMEGALLSVADKLDSVVGAFAIGLVPTGSKDPLALRRQTMCLLKVLLDKDISISIKKIFKRSFSLYRRKASRPLEETLQDFGSFVKERLRYILRERGFRYDEVNSVVEISFDNPLDCLLRVRAVAAMRDSDDFTSVAQSFKRIKNILIKSGHEALMDTEVVPDLFGCPEERVLHQAVVRIKPRVRRACRQGEYRRAFEAMAALRPQIDRFFDKVLVMAEEPAIRRNRLALLGGLLEVFLELADVSEIVPPQV